jgi:hypothetical protein
MFRVAVDFGTTGQLKETDPVVRPDGAHGPGAFIFEARIRVSAENAQSPDLFGGTTDGADASVAEV